jgi:hypothetical protein
VQALQTTISGLNDAKYWRDPAAEMRVLSAAMQNFENPNLMLKLANDQTR